jgi:hypothetical protein
MFLNHTDTLDELKQVTAELPDVNIYIRELWASNYLARRR